MKKKKTLRFLLKTVIVLAIVAVCIGAVYLYQSANNKIKTTVTQSEAQDLVNEAISALPESVSPGAKYIVENSSITVNEIKYGNEKNIILYCTYETVNANKVISENIASYLKDAYSQYLSMKEKGVANATKLKLFLNEKITADIGNSEKVSGNVTIELFQMNDETLSVYYSDELVNTVLGGILDANRTVDAIDEIEYDGQDISIENLKTVKRGVSDCFKLSNYDSEKPDTAVPIVRAWNSLKRDFYRNFIEKARWTLLVDGLVMTLKITFCAVIMGIVIGFVVAMIRVTNHSTGKLKIASDICKVYLSVMRGTPVMIQLLIIYYVILSPLGIATFPAAVICFGLNSGAYVSEIVRAGIVSIDKGQMEAGRSLGFNYIQTMYHIVVPQAFKAVLPSLANEFIALLKESSIAFYIGIADLTNAGNKIRSNTYSTFMPFIAVALIYLVLVLGLTKCVNILERRLQKGDKS